MQFSIKGADGNLTVELQHRNYPNSQDYYDSNWVTAKITISIPGYKGILNGSLLTFEIENFANQIKQMYEKLTDNCNFSSLEGLIKIKANMNKLGHIAWNIETTYPVGVGANLNFSLASDQSYLPDIISEMNLIAKAFPVLNLK